MAVASRFFLLAAANLRLPAGVDLSFLILASGAYTSPVSEDFYITASISILGGVAGYVATIIAHPYPNKGTLGAVSTLGTVLGFVIGKNTFYKSQKIDISGRLRG